jgi:hypothetical protein
MYVVCPIREQAGQEQFNTAVLIDRAGKVAGTYRKVFVFWGEGLVPSREGVKAFDADFGRIAILTCFDINFPELWQQADSLGAEIVFWPSAYGGGIPLNAYAMLHHYYVVPVGAGNLIDITGRTLEGPPTEKGTGPICRNGPQGASHKLDQSPFPPQVIAKIEKPEALEHLEEIVSAADGVMVARGDLGVEIDIARVAMAQKEIIAACNRLRKPVIVATQMLDSMTHSRIPTRAEVADVSNAILDGADACMLSGETAIGEYPRETVEMMQRIALETETGKTGTGSEPGWRERYATGAGAVPVPVFPVGSRSSSGLNPITEATVSAAGHIAEELGAKVVVVATASGATALSMAKNRHFVPTLGVSDSPATLRRMCLYWGVIPLAGAPTSDPAALLRHVTDLGRAAGLLHAGDRIVLIAGTGLAVTRHNMIVVHELE